MTEKLQNQVRNGKGDLETAEWSMATCSVASSESLLRISTLQACEVSEEGPRALSRLGSARLALLWSRLQPWSCLWSHLGADRLGA